MTGKPLARRLALLALPLLTLFACDDPTDPSTPGTPAASARRVPPPQLTPLLWGSSSDSPINPGSLFSIDPATGTATLIGHHGMLEGFNRLSSVAIDPATGRLYGIKGGPCYGALLVTFNPLSGAATLIDTLNGGWFDGTPGPNCPGGSASVAFAADGTLYASGWYGGIPQGKIMRVDKATGAVLEVHPMPVGFDDWRGRRAHLNGLAFDANGVLWASRGNSVTRAQINIVDPATGDITRTLYLNDPVMEDSLTISDLAFGTDGKLYASLPWESMLAEIDTATGNVTRIGSFGPSVRQISGLAAALRTPPEPVGRYWLNEASSGQGPTTAFDDRPNPVNLTISYSASLSWTEESGHRGLDSSAFSHSGRASASADGNKYESALHGSTQATFETVASMQTPPYTATIAAFQTRGAVQQRCKALLINTSGQPTVQLRTASQSNITVLWPVSLGDDVRRVMHIVYDSNDSTPSRRIRLYVDGVDQSAGQLTSGNWPAQGETLLFNLSNLDIELIGYRFLFWAFPMAGTVYYYAAYDVALNETEIAIYADALSADDDNL